MTTATTESHRTAAEATALEISATFRLVKMCEQHPDLASHERWARRTLAEAIIAMDAVDDGPALAEQARVEEALRAYGDALAALLRGDDSVLVDAPAESSICQVADPSQESVCSAIESGGLRCENPTPSHGDGQHWISDHTIRHALAGNGYACSAFED